MNKSAILDHAILVCGALIMLLPVAGLFLTSTHCNGTIGSEGMQVTWGGRFSEVYGPVLTRQGLFSNDISAMDMLFNSLVLAVGFAGIKSVASMLAAYALIYFRIPYAGVLFAAILVTMFFPIETRILPTFLVTHEVGLLNSFGGLILPLTATGFGTLFFRQFYKQVTEEVLEAAKLDAAGPVRFFVDILVPLSMPSFLALFAILFVLGWNQYLWPLMVTTGNEGLFTVVRGIERAGRAGNTGMALAVIAILPPGLLVLVLQRWIVRGLIDWRQ